MNLEFKNFISTNNEDSKIYIKLLEKTPKDLKCCDCEGNIISSDKLIYFITKDINAYEDESIIKDIVLCKDIDLFIYYMKRAGRHNVKYKTCKVLEDRYSYKNDEMFICVNDNFYPNMLRYINNKIEQINEDDVDKKLNNRIQNIRPRNGVSGYYGVKVVSINPLKFISNINKDKKRYYLGSYKEEKIAAYAYDCIAKEFFGENYKKINYIEKPDGYYWDKEKKRVLKD